MGLFSFLHSKAKKGRSPEEAAQPYFNKIPGILTESQQPYINRGNEAYNQVAPQYNQMTSNPGNFLDQLMQGYKPSQGYGYRENRLQQALGNTAAAGGFRGTGEDQYNQAELVNSLMGQDMQQYLQNVLGVQGAGLQGLENIQNRGYQSSGNLGSGLANLASMQGGLAFQNRREEIQQSNDRRQAFLNMLGQLAGTAIGSFGGPAGAAIGGKIGGSLAGGGNSPMGAAGGAANSYGAQGNYVGSPNGYVGNSLFKGMF